MKEQFVTYEIALKLKELGFDEKCFGYYSEQHDKTKLLCLYQEEDYFDEIRLEAPLWQQVIDWLREKYNLYISIEANFSKKRWYFVVGNLWEYNSGSFFDDFKTHYEAKEQAILKAIELCQKK